MLFQQLCGISPVMYFTTRILTPVFDQEARAVAFLIIVVKVLITLISALFVKVSRHVWVAYFRTRLNMLQRFGPKNLLVYPTLVMSVAGVCLTAGIVRSSGSVSAVSMALFIAAFACGLGPMTWLVPSEVMPRRARNASGTLGVSLNWLGNFVMVSTITPTDKLKLL
jgi:hypothetical protein